MSSPYLEPRERQRAAAVIAALESGLEESADAVVVVDRHGDVAHASPRAWELLAAYGGLSPPDGASLPPPIDDWVRAADGHGTHEPLSVAGDRGLLHVRMVDGGGAGPWRGLVLSERRVRRPSIDSLCALGLSTREAQVLRLVACGKRDRDIAGDLGISVGTVRKHLQRIYRKLGVESRTQAVARALE